MLNDDEGKKVQHLLEVMVEKVSFKKRSRRSFQNSDLHIPKSLKCKKRNGLFPKLLFKSFFKKKTKTHCVGGKRTLTNLFSRENCSKLHKDEKVLLHDIHPL